MPPRADPLQEEGARTVRTASVGAPLRGPKRLTVLDAYRFLVECARASLHRAAREEGARAEVLLGVHGQVTLPRSSVRWLLTECDFEAAVDPVEVSEELARLGELFSAFGMRARYVVEATEVDVPCTPSPLVTADGGSRYLAHYHVLPIALFRWLTLADAHEHTQMRLLACPEEHRPTPFGLSGQGVGEVRCGLTDHALGATRGCGLLVLGLVSAPAAKWCYDVEFALHHPPLAVSNALVFARGTGAHVLPLGAVRAWRQGWGWGAAAAAPGGAGS